MLPPSESLRDAAAVILEHLRTDGLFSQRARELGLLGFVVWPQIESGSAPHFLYQNMAHILVGVEETDPIITQTAWGSVRYDGQDNIYQIMAETPQGEIAITPATPDISPNGTVFWFDQHALASLLTLASEDRETTLSLHHIARFQASR